MVTDTDPGNPVNADMWRAIGRLEGVTTAILEGQRDLKAEMLEGHREIRAEMLGIKAEMLEGQREFRVELQSAHQRIDRLFYAILAVGGATLAVVIANRFIGG